MSKTQFPISVIMEKRPSVSRWADAYWAAVGLIVGKQAATEMTLLHTDGDIEQYLYPNLTVSLHRDECESYYHNMMSPNPSCYIVARTAEDGIPKPFLVSMSFDEAHAYQENEDQAYSVEIPAELYEWMESYMIDNYFPEKRFKRKLKDWKHGSEKPAS
ncbi:DUF3305 domain-containing protein [Leucothrix mucor]|uniref:DUF3305 domain-containing protein n=1 Tax=Leucothrix mucor TaxID=45248 RepID=UPI0003B3591F|nr:DUF3305 domain-containing protein [Leucothrix mucor]